MAGVDRRIGGAKTPQAGRLTTAQFHGAAYRKYSIGAHYGSREFCAYGKRISRVNGEFWLLRVRTPRYYRHSTLTRPTQKFGACTRKRGTVIVSAVRR